MILDDEAQTPTSRHAEAYLENFLTTLNVFLNDFMCYIIFIGLPRLWHAFI